MFFSFWIIFYWSIVALQCCANFFCKAKLISYTYTCIPSLLDFQSRSPQWTKSSSLCYMVCSHQLSILKIVSIVCMCWSQSLNSSHPSFPSWYLYACSPCLCLYFSFANRIIYTMAQMVKCLPAMWETWVQSQGWEDLLEKEMATHSSILS